MSHSSPESCSSRRQSKVSRGKSPPYFPPINLTSHLAHQALFLPEASDYIAGSAAETISLAQSVATSPFVLGLQKAAAINKLAINVGIHEPAEGGKRVKNTVIWIDDTGQITERYQKLHLFDVDIEGGPVLKESHSVEPGSTVARPFETAIGTVGLLICFDLRFPTLSTRIRDLGAQVLTFPSAFTVPTGAAHWEVLLRARAIESQSYVLAAAQVGNHSEKRASYGHSLIVDPWGQVVAEGSGTESWEQSGRQPELVVGEVDLERVKKVRKEMPLKPRTDVLEIVER